MGIYNGPSIYNQGGGGGGGGYNDGGQIVDADFMKVENNAVSSYDNTSRDPINFYFEPADGEILNSIIELTTAVNATVNVYVFRNGFYYLLGNIGGNTVNAGEEYKVNITGDSYAIENVSSTSNEFFVDIDGTLVKVVKINDQYWTDYIKLSDPGSEYIDKTNFGLTIRYYRYNSIRNYGDFRVPSQNDINKLISYVGSGNIIKLRSTSNWAGGQNGTDNFGFNAQPIAGLNSAGNFPLNDGVGYVQELWTSETSGSNAGSFYINRNNNYGVSYISKNEYKAIKYVCDV